jgi:hypothetical protein
MEKKICKKTYIKQYIYELKKYIDDILKIEELEDIKNQVIEIFTPITQLLLYKIYPYIYIIIFLVVLIFVLIITILVLLLLLFLKLNK